MDQRPTASQDFSNDDIDRFAANLLRHPDRAEWLKRDLRARIGLGPRRAAAAVETEGDPEDLWDNVPV